MRTPEMCFAWVRARHRFVEATVEMYLTRALPWESSGPCERLPATAMRVFSESRVPEGMPFFLGEDGTYDHLVNDFLRELPSLGCPAENTWRAYALDLSGLAEFLAARDPPRSLLGAIYEDMRAYRDARRLEDDEVSGIAAGTWNRSVSAFDKFYRWAEARGVRGSPPFTYRQGRDRRGGTVQVNTLYEAAGMDDRIKCVSLDDYRAFRDVGLRGMLPGPGTRDPNFNGRNSERNALIADVLLNAGMRITEFCSLLQTEIPKRTGVTGERGATPVKVAPFTAKRRRGRTVMVSNRLVVRISDYVAVDRAGAIFNGRESAAYEDGSEWTLMRPHDLRRAALVVPGGQRLKPYDGMKPMLRGRLLLVDDAGEPLEPAALWLGEDGRPIRPDNVRTIFRRACKRCEDLLQRPFEITPHTLRHTFAVQMLSLLIDEHLRASRVAPPWDRRSGMGVDAFREHALNPLRVLKNLLGHRSVETTFGYLTHIVDVRRSEAGASSAFDDVMQDQDEILRAAKDAVEDLEDEA